jgi:hypothetical protein
VNYYKVGGNSEHGRYVAALIRGEYERDYYETDTQAKLIPETEMLADPELADALARFRSGDDPVLAEVDRVFALWLRSLKAQDEAGGKHTALDRQLVALSQ